MMNRQEVSVAGKGRAGSDCAQLCRLRKGVFVFVLKVVESHWSISSRGSRIKHLDRMLLSAEWIGRGRLTGCGECMCRGRAVGVMQAADALAWIRVAAGDVESRGLFWDFGGKVGRTPGWMKQEVWERRACHGTLPGIRLGHWMAVETVR